MGRGRGKLTPQDREYMKEFSINLNNLLSSRNMKQVELAKALDIPTATINGYCRGTSLPIPGNVQKIANFFGLKKSDIDIRFLSDNSTNTLQKINSICSLLTPDRQNIVLNVAKEQKQLQDKKVIQLDENITIQSVTVTEAVAAGVGYSYGNNETTQFYTDRNDLKSYDIASLVTGDSMYPLYNDGDIVLIRNGYDHEQGAIYVLDYDGKSYVKKVYMDALGCRLVSINPKYKDIFIELPIKDYTYFNIVGKVVDGFKPITI